MKKILFLLGFLPTALFAQNINNFSGISIEPSFIEKLPKNIFENKNLYTVNSQKNFDYNSVNSCVENYGISIENSSSTSFSSTSFSSFNQSSNIIDTRNIIDTSSIGNPIITPVSSFSSSSSSNSSISSSFDQCSRENIDSFRQQGKDLANKGNQTRTNLMNESNQIGKYLSVAKYCRQNRKNCESQAKSGASKNIDNIKNYEKEIFDLNTQIQNYNNLVNYKMTICNVGILPLDFIGNYTLSYTGNTNFDKKNIEPYINKVNLKNQKINFENYIKDPSTKNLDLINTDDFLNIMQQINDTQERKIFKDNKKRI